MDKKLIKACTNEIAQRVNSCRTVPQLRAAYKKQYSFSKLPFGEQLFIWDAIWKQESDYKIKIQAFFYCEQHATRKQNLSLAWDTLKHWQNHVNDWTYCDSLSKIFTKHLEVFPNEVFAQLKEWNSHKDLWKRRQSIVSLMYYTRTKKIILPYHKMQPLIHNLLHDEEYYVQKGVGWSLREMYNAYPELTFEYFKKNIKNISPIAFSAATEKLNTKQKDLLKSLRK
ncbi:MAG: DNA alkylation repair protein [Bacteroidia bacterium]